MCVSHLFHFHFRDSGLRVPSLFATRIWHHNLFPRHISVSNPGCCWWASYNISECQWASYTISYTMIKLSSVSVRGAQEPAHSWAAATASTNICHLSKVTVAVSIICRDITYFRMAQNTKIPKIPKSLAKIMCIPKHLIVDCWDNWYCQKSSCILKVLVLFLCNLNSCKLFYFKCEFKADGGLGEL